jgi:hypothetical protein
VSRSGWLASAIFCAAGFFLMTFSAQGYTNLTSAFSAMGFDPSLPGNAVVVLFSDAHMDAGGAGVTPGVLTSNLNPFLVSTVNAMDPPPVKIVVAGDVSTGYCQTPGGHANSNDAYVASIEMTWWSSAVHAFTNIAQTNILWVPGNHDQMVDETNAELFCRMFPNMPPYQAFELAGVKFFLLNSGAYCDFSDSEEQWLRQQVAATPPTQNVAVVTHFPVIDDTIYRGMYPVLRELFGNWQTRWWSIYGHTHGGWNEVATVGATNVALFNVGTANTNMAGGIYGDAGFSFLCLSNKDISGIVYYRYNATAIGQGDFEVDYGFPNNREQFGPPWWPNWGQPTPFVAAFEASSGLLWRRFKTREPAPEVVLVNGADCGNWFAYDVELQLELPLGQCANQATDFLLLMPRLLWNMRADFSADRTNWIQVPFLQENYRYNVVTCPIPPEISCCATGYFRFTAPWANNYICGWGLSTTNAPPLACFPQLAEVPDQQVLVGDELVVTNVASEPYASPQDFTFTLLSGPNGATLDPQSGVFRWQPMLADAPATVPVVVKVADRGTPEMSATQQFWITVTLTNTPGALTVLGITANHKFYDGTTNATLVVTNAVLVGVASGEDVHLDTSHTVGSFGDAAVGARKTVTVRGLALLGADASKYSLMQPTTIADIRPARVTPTLTVANKVYDAATSATITGRSLSGIVGSEDVSLGSSGAANFADKNAGTGKKVIVTSLSLSGSAAANYVLPAFTAITKADITPLPITVTANPQNKVFANPDPVFSYQVSNGSVIGGSSLLGGDSFLGNLSRAPGENLGIYTILPGSLTAGSSYTITYLPADLTIARGNSTSTVVSTLNPTAPRTTVTITALLFPIAPDGLRPTGSVQFYLNGAAFGSPISITAGVAAFSTAELPVGTNVILATYPGDSNCVGSTNSLAQIVDPSVVRPGVIGIAVSGSATVTVTFSGTPGTNYVVQACTKLVAPVWENVSTNTADAQGGWSFTEPSGLLRRFYRAATR